MSEQPRNDALTLVNNSNFRYCVLFLRNSGEKIRAIRLVIDVANLSLVDARQWVEQLSERLPCVANRERKVWCKMCRTEYAANDARLIVGLCPLCGEMIQFEKDYYV